MINSNNTYIYLKITFGVFICDVVLIQTCFLFSKIVFHEVYKDNWDIVSPS